MDWIAIRKTAGLYFGKYKFALLILAVGLFLLSFPQTKDQSPELPEPVMTEEESLEIRLGAILGKIQGVGEVQVLLTEARGCESVYQVDGNDRRETVIIKDENRSESGLVKQVISPVYQGAIVVCQGGNSPSVCLAVMEAVANVTGISTSRITVLKMN